MTKRKSAKKKTRRSRRAGTNSSGPRVRFKKKAKKKAKKKV